MANDNLIDLSQRRTTTVEKSRLRDLKMRIDVEQAKILVSTSLISVLFLATFANRAVLSTSPDVTVADSGRMELSSRGPASVRTGASDWEDEIASRLSKASLKETASIGQAPSPLEQLRLGFLEGRYAVRAENGKIREIQLSDSRDTGGALKHVTNRSLFLEQHRQLLPVEFDRSVKVASSHTDKDFFESYELINRAAMPLGRVEFHMDTAGGLLGMKVIAQ